MTKDKLKKATELYNGYSGVCGCGNCVITKSVLLKVIKNYLIIDESKWCKTKTIIENIQLPHTLLSRFDLIFLILSRFDSIH